MNMAFTKSVITKNSIVCSQLIFPLLALATCLLAILAANVYGDNASENDVNLWLKNTVFQTATPSETVYYSSGEMPNILTSHPFNSSPFDSPTYSLANLDIKINHRSFQTSNKSIAKANEKKLLKRLSEKFKVTLFSSEKRRNKHHFYLNAAKRELVGKSRIGKAKYEVRVSEKKAEANFRYIF